MNKIRVLAHNVVYNTNKILAWRPHLSDPTFACKEHSMNLLRPLLHILLVSLCLGVLLGSRLAQAAVIGQMPAHGDILYITADPCTSESGRIEPNWYFSYSVNAAGSVSRSCYVKYNDQIWIRGPFGAESTYPMSYFSKPTGSLASESAASGAGAGTGSGSGSSSAPPENKPNATPEAKP